MKVITTIKTIYGWEGIYKGSDRSSKWCIKTKRCDNNKEYILKVDEVCFATSNGVKRTGQEFAKILSLPR